MTRIGVALAIVLLVIGMPAPALAFVPRGGDRVIISEPLRDDLYVAGQTIEINAPIDGDVAAAGYRITVSAPITGAVLAAGATIGIDNRVERSVRAAGGYVAVEGTVGTDAVLLGSQVRIFGRAQIGRDLVAAGRRIRQEGSVGRNAFFNGGRVVIAGTITGDVQVTADSLIVADTARIGGRLTYSATQAADIRQGAQISGGIERLARAPTRRRFVSPTIVPELGWFAVVVEVLWLLVVGFLALAISTRGVLAVADHIRRRFWMSLLAGFVLAVVTPVAAIFLFITLLGIPVGGIVLLLYAATLYPAMVFTAAWLGEWVLRQVRGSATTDPSPYLPMLVGVVAIAIGNAVPIVGWIVRAAAILVGFGALWAKLWAARNGTPEQATPVSAQPSGGGSGAG